MVELLSPATLLDLRTLAGTGRIIAGGTDLIVQMRSGRNETHLIDITNIEDAPPAAIIRSGVAELSAMASITKVVDELNGRLPGIAAAAQVFASLQIRNRATIGGNLANASPAGDMIPPLVAAEAYAVVDGPSGQRRIPVDELITGPGRTVLEPNEWLSLVGVPLFEGEEGFIKLGGRTAMAISIVSLAWRWHRSDHGALTGVRIALGAVAPTVVRAHKAEAILEGQQPTADVVMAATDALQTEISPIGDVRASAGYRQAVAGGLLRQALATS
ncbi:MAG: FAD binding domain-containing protein [Acidimicrobiia bacterium]|nr:FAD binding domain-containing protein [Acidimicrobiia bacterium]